MSQSPWWPCGTWSLCIQNLSLRCTTHLRETKQKPKQNPCFYEVGPVGHEWLKMGWFSWPSFCHLLNLGAFPLFDFLGFFLVGSFWEVGFLWGPPPWLLKFQPQLGSAMGEKCFHWSPLLSLVKIPIFFGEILRHSFGYPERSNCFWTKWKETKTSNRLGFCVASEFNGLDVDNNVTIFSTCGNYFKHLNIDSSYYNGVCG